MQLCRLQAGLAWLLAVAVLLGSVAPPTVEHAHADGERSHDHGAADLHEGRHKHPHPHPHPHSHKHSHSHKHPHPPSGDGERELLQCRTMHRHVILFGFELYMPASDHQDLPGPGNKLGDEALTLVRLLETEVVLTYAPAGGRLFDSLPLSYSCVAPCATSMARAQDGPAMLASLPLSDSARGERSGVQLI